MHTLLKLPLLVAQGDDIVRRDSCGSGGVALAIAVPIVVIVVVIVVAAIVVALVPRVGEGVVERLLRLLLRGLGLLSSRASGGVRRRGVAARRAAA